MSDEREPVLCYVENNFAYFTYQPLEEQWGDDWDDAPYEHNAETPYNEPSSLLCEVLAFTSSLDAPNAYVLNSPYSVKDINAKITPWLSDRAYNPRNPTEIYAGTPLSEFKRLVRAAGGEIFVKEIT